MYWRGPQFTGGIMRKRMPHAVGCRFRAAVLSQSGGEW